MGSTITRRGALKGSAALAALAASAAAARGPTTGSKPTACRRSATSRCRPISSASPMSIPTRRRAACCRCRSPRPRATRTSTPSTRSTSSPSSGDGAAGMSATFDTLMSGNGDEPDSLYGLLARAVQRQPRQARLSLPAAPRGALRRRLEGDGGRRHVLARRAQGEGASDLFAIAGRGRQRRRRGRRRRAGALRQGAHARRASRSSPACRSSPPRGGRGATSTLRRSRRRSAPAPTRSRRSSRGASSNSSCDDDYWAKDLPINVGQNNFRRLRFEYYRERQVAFEAFKAGAINFHRGVHLALLGDRLRFPRLQRRQGEEGIAAQRRADRLAGLVLQHPARTVQGPARARGDRPRASISNGRTRT